MEVEEKPKKESKAGKWGCLIAIIILALLLIAFFTGIFDFQEIENSSGIWNSGKKIMEVVQLA